MCSDVGWTVLPLSVTLYKEQRKNVHVHVRAFQREGVGAVLFSTDGRVTGVKMGVCSHIGGQLECVFSLSTSEVPLHLRGF